MSKALEKYSSIRSVCIHVPVFLSFRHLKQGIQEFHRKYVLVPADKATNNVVVVCWLQYVNTLKQELDGTRSYLETDTDEMSVVNAHLNDLPVKFSVCVNEGQDKLQKIITRYRRIGYNLNVMRQSACLVFNPIMVDNYAAFFNCTPVGRASDSMMAPT